jgi:hypothetical protein
MQKLRQGIPNLLLLLPILSPLINSLILSNLPNSSTILSTAAQLHARWKALAKTKTNNKFLSSTSNKRNPTGQNEQNGKQQCAKKSRFGKSDDFSGAGKS